jgi:hypothetical protein
MDETPFRLTRRCRFPLRPISQMAAGGYQPSGNSACGLSFRPVRLVEIGKTHHPAVLEMAFRP